MDQDSLVYIVVDRVGAPYRVLLYQPGIRFIHLSNSKGLCLQHDCGIASILPFRIDVPSSSESIQFCAETTRTEPDDKVELGEVLGPPCLPPG